MTGSTISGSISVAVTLDSSQYGSELFIYGEVDPEGASGANGTAVTAEDQGDSIVNYGLVAGGDGDNDGGYGFILENGAQLYNAGEVEGGSNVAAPVGAYVGSGSKLVNEHDISGGFDSSGGAVGVIVVGGVLVNEGVIDGGSGSPNYGAGVEVTEGFLDNTGDIVGGEPIPQRQEGGNGADGVDFNGGVFDDSGAVSAGLGEPQYEPGVPPSDWGSASSGDAVVFGTNASTLVVYPGAEFYGDVVGNPSASDVLVLGANSSGTLDMGGSFSGFSTISFGSSSSWLVSGTVNEFSGGEVVEGFSAGDTILVTNFFETSASYSSNAVVLDDGSSTETIDLVGELQSDAFSCTSNTLGTEISLLCYLYGTNILTPVGERPIETLNIGDTVVTRYGGYRRIKWIGLQSFTRRFIVNNRDQIPVRILAGALGPNLPHRDLNISPGHSMLIGNSLVLARNLVNGITVRQDDCPEEVRYYQLEFEAHDCVRAEGAWSESFCDYGDLRNQFHNVADFHRLYPDHVTPTEHLLCAPRPELGLALEAILRPLTYRTTALVRFGALQGWVDEVTPDRIAGWAQDISNPYLPVLLEILFKDEVIGSILACDYRPDLAAAKVAGGRCAFTFTYDGEVTLAELKVRRALDNVILPMGPRCDHLLKRA